MVLNATFNYISAISWLSVLLVEETRLHNTPAAVQCRPKLVAIASFKIIFDSAAFHPKWLISIGTNLSRKDT
jgi:hypothetical protein